MLPLALGARAESEILTGRFAEAQALYEEMREIPHHRQSGHDRGVPPGEVMVAALRGDEDRPGTWRRRSPGTPPSTGSACWPTGRRTVWASSRSAMGATPKAMGYLQFALDVPYSFVARALCPSGRGGRPR